MLGEKYGAEANLFLCLRCVSVFAEASLLQWRMASRGWQRSGALDTTT
jgi:hypothetical protein